MGIDIDMAKYEDMYQKVEIDMGAYARRLSENEGLAKGKLVCDPSVCVYCNNLGKSFYGIRQLLKGYEVRLPSICRRRQLANLRKLVLKRKPDMADAIDRKYWYVKRG